MGEIDDEFAQWRTDGNAIWLVDVIAANNGKARKVGENSNAAVLIDAANLLRYGKRLTMPPDDLSSKPR